MKNKKILYVVLGLGIMLGSCDDFLDTMPDNRAELNTEAKVASILVSAYPDKLPIVLMEYGTDNVMDNGALYSSYTAKEEAYLWKDITTESNDDPKYLWQAHYIAVAAANQALETIEELGNPVSLQPQRAEALLCRAYSLFSLSNVFCLPYNPETANQDMGLPYPLKPETQVIVQYERGTMEELYQNIYRDIEEALPNIRDDVYAVPKYHFNKKAAYAFAARFNLLYVKKDKSNFQKVIDYATQALGSNPANVVRNISAYLPLGATDINNAYVQASEPANLLLIPIYSVTGRYIRGSLGPRHNHSRDIVSFETIWAMGPWGSNGSSGFLISKLYANGNQNVFFPKLLEFWEYTDKTGGSGFAHVVHTAFTTDETLLCRAEAYTFLERYTEAAADLNVWQQARCNKTYTDTQGGVNTLKTLTPEIINTFFSNLPYAAVPLKAVNGSDRSIKKTLHPQGFNVAAGMQENFVHCILHFRRLENLHDGQRWVDVKRYGIEVTHNIDGEEPDVLRSNDPRRARQLPADVINAGLTANPR